MDYSSISQYLLPFLIGFGVSSVVLILVYLFGQRISRVVEVHRKHKNISRFGGLAIGIAFLLVVLSNPVLERTPELWGLVLGGVVAITFGTLDDLFPIPWPTQLFVQVGLGVLLFLSGMQAWVVTNPFGDPILLSPASNPWPSLVIGILFTVLIINAMNWADGVDGLLPGISSVAALAVLFVSLRPEVNQPAVAILALSLLGCVLALLVWNAPPARLLSGTAGAYFLGFIISALALYSGVKIATVLLALSVPVLDALFVIRERIRAGESPFRGGDARHLHDRLRSIGWSDRRIVVSYMAVSILSAGAALLLPTAGKFWFLLALAFGFVFLISWLEQSLKKRETI
jgi:UDP-GlcNAc:undecaprenyl-phosphate GlcNAc-1-phosphate transferase